MEDIIIGIPGRWSTQAEIISSVNESQYLLCSSNQVKDLRQNQNYHFEVYDYDPQLSKAFSLAGRQSLNKQDLEAIDSHTYTVYITAPGGSIESAYRAMEVSGKLLTCGGLAIKVESSGIAHCFQDWLTLTMQQDIFSIYKAYVTLIGNDGTYYSCGMHNLGCRDAILKDNISPNEAAQLLETFLLYLLNENPSIKDGDKFSTSPESKVYKVLHQDCDLYSPDNYFHNSFGMWELAPE